MSSATSSPVLAGNHVQLAPGSIVKLRDPIVVVILTVVTLGIYQLFWWYYANRELADYGRARGTRGELGDNPTMSVLALFPGALIVVPAIWTTVTTFKRVQAAQRMNGEPQINGWLGVVIVPRHLPRARRVHAERAQLGVEGTCFRRDGGAHRSVSDEWPSSRGSEPRSCRAASPDGAHPTSRARSTGRSCDRGRRGIGQGRGDSEPRALPTRRDRDVLLVGARLRLPARGAHSRAPPHRGERDVRQVMALEWPQLQAGVPLAIPLVAGALGLLDAATSLALALLVGVLTLVGWGVVFARREGQPPWGVALVAILNACVGLLIVALKAALP